MKKNIFPFLSRLVSALLLLIVFSQLCYFIFDELAKMTSVMMDRISPLLHCYVLVITMIPLSFSLFRASFITAPALCNAYLEQRDEQLPSAKLSFLMKQKTFWVICGIVALIYILCPMETIFTALDRLVPTGDSPVAKAKVLAVLLPILFLIAVLAHLSAYSYLDKHKKPAQNEFKTCVPAIVMLFSAFALTRVIPLVWPALSRLPYGTIAILLLVLFLGLNAFRLIRGFIKRRSFLIGLERVCREKGYSISALSCPYRSLLLFKKGETFTVTVEDRIYSCKLISALMRNTPLAIYSEGILSFVHILRLFRTELFQLNSVYRYGYEAEHPQILIVNPTPKHIYTFRGGKSVEIDNGEPVGDYTVYTASAFLHALERDVLGKV